MSNKININLGDLENYLREAFKLGWESYRDMEDEVIASMLDDISSECEKTKEQKKLFEDNYVTVGAVPQYTYSTTLNRGLDGFYETSTYSNTSSNSVDASGNYYL